MALKLITAAATYPVTLAEAKAHLSVDFDDHDALIEIYRKAATDSAENFTGRAFIDQTWDYFFDAFPTAGAIQIPKPPLIEVIGVFSLDSVAAEQELAASGYLVDGASELARLTLAYAGSWPTPLIVANAVRLRFRAGYLDDNSPQVANVPFAIKAAILLTVGTLYANRETIVIGQTATLLPWAAEQLLRPYRVHTAIA